MRTNFEKSVAWDKGNNLPFNETEEGEKIQNPKIE